MSENFPNIEKEFREFLEKEENINFSNALNMMFHNSIINRSLLQAVLDAQIEILSELTEADHSEIYQRYQSNQLDYARQILKRQTGIDLDKEGTPPE